MSKKRNLRCLSRARKIREGLLRRFSGIPLPVKNTIHTVLAGMAWWNGAAAYAVARRALRYL